jgi:hypothetical protein
VVSYVASARITPAEPAEPTTATRAAAADPSVTPRA